MRIAAFVAYLMIAPEAGFNTDQLTRPCRGRSVYDSVVHSRNIFNKIAGHEDML